MIDNMFHSAALKLTVWYLSIIMIVSISFSGAVYHFASNELIRTSQRQQRFFDQYQYEFPPQVPGYENFRVRTLQSSMSDIRDELVVLNLSVLLLGGALSYYMARKTLRPIEDNMEAQRRFTGDASHELRTPLTVMQAENEVALRNPDLTKKEAVDLLKSNLEEVAKLKALSDGLLRLANIDNNQLRSDVVSAKFVAERAIERWSKVAKDKKITIKTDLKEVNVQGDPDSLTDLVSILLDNAIKYGGGKPVSIKTYKKDKQVFIEVADHGQGIAAADLPHIFDRFYRADTSRNKNQIDGHGLGLAIAKQVADLHDGSIEVKSSAGHGSTFALRLPSV
ncbi:MAG TPA: HAMP domain-containing sensor histidine kinase [Candidatus Binatia bacterium]|nr:HAMP domain-containing sensor histidine kinase [Candidatus Binatia bacterium]